MNKISRDTFKAQTPEQRAADVAWALKQPNPMKAYALRHGNKPTGFHTGTAAQKTAAQLRRDGILRMLMAEGPISAPEIAKRLDMPRQVVNNDMYRMKSQVSAVVACKPRHHTPAQWVAGELAQ